MDLKKILINAGIEADKVEELKDSITREIGTDFIPKTQYQKKVLALNELQEKFNDVEAKASNPVTDEYKAKYEALEAEFTGFKDKLEKEKINGTKISKLKESLKAEKFNENIIDLLVKEFDMDKVEIENEAIKDWEGLVNPIKTKYNGFIAQEITTGAEAGKPPVNGAVKTDTNPLADALGKFL